METNIEITREEGGSMGCSVAVADGQRAKKTYS